MKNHTLLNCIEVLEKVRNIPNSQLDTCVLTELDDVINELKMLNNNNQSDMKLGDISFKALEVISRIVSIICDFTDFMG